jgi:hypothetical protein
MLTQPELAVCFDSRCALEQQHGRGTWLLRPGMHVSPCACLLDQAPQSKETSP